MSDNIQDAWMVTYRNKPNMDFFDTEEEADQAVASNGEGIKTPISNIIRPDGTIARVDRITGSN